MSTAPSRAARVEINSHEDRSFFGTPLAVSRRSSSPRCGSDSAYGMRALLILFMTAAPATGRLGSTPCPAGALYGLYTSMVISRICSADGWPID